MIFTTFLETVQITDSRHVSTCLIGKEVTTVMLINQGLYGNVSMSEQSQEVNYEYSKFKFSVLPFKPMK